MRLSSICGLHGDDTEQEDQCEQSERFSEQDKRNYVIMIAELILILYFFFHDNKSYGVKFICIDPLSTHCCTSCREH